MTTKLEKPLRREVRIGRDAWIVTIAPDRMKLVRKLKRKGIELGWESLVNGDAALAAALNASERAVRLPRRKPPAARKPSAASRVPAASTKTRRRRSSSRQDGLPTR